MGLEAIERNLMEMVRLSKYMEACVANDSRFEIIAPQSFGLVCFRLRGKGNDEQVKLHESVMSHNFWLSTSVVGDICFHRVSVTPTTTQESLEALWKVYQLEAGNPS